MQKSINNKYISIILARKGSKRIKNKNLVNISGKPLIEYTLDAIAKIMPLNNIYVSTNDKNVIKIAKKYNINFIKRPDILCKDNSSSEDGIIHAIRMIEIDREFNHVIFLQPTSPLRDGVDIFNCVKKYEKKKLDSIFSAYLAKRFIWTKTKRLYSLTFNYKKRQRSQRLQNLIIENGAIFIFNVKKFLKFKNRIFGKFDFYEMEENKSFDIDDLQDLKIVKKLLE
jgi:CMP-N,N'-diacetyllegionaminic acid synthase